MMTNDNTWICTIYEACVWYHNELTENKLLTTKISLQCPQVTLNLARLGEGKVATDGVAGLGERSMIRLLQRKWNILNTMIHKAVPFMTMKSTCVWYDLSLSLSPSLPPSLPPSPLPPSLPACLPACLC